MLMAMAVKYIYVYTCFKILNFMLVKIDDKLRYTLMVAINDYKKITLKKTYKMFLENCN